MSRAGAVLAAIALVLGAALATWHDGRWRLPERHDPWAPLSIEEPPGWTTRWKLARLSDDPQACR
ncbi:MAG TPA: extensin, partial [Burkholderiaceae bacterium]|nr:extensin [Burkholderiaceae bacterium]